MNDGKSPSATPHPERRRATDEPARARAKPAAWDPHWMDRTRKAGGRHSAITRTLYNWSSYKSWADKVRNYWDREK
jgi:hypothetical protein